MACSSSGHIGHPVFRRENKRLIYSMRVNFQDISTEFLKNRNELLPGGYFVEIIDFLALQPIFGQNR